MSVKKILFSLSVLLILLIVVLVIRSNSFSNVLGIATTNFDDGYNVIDLGKWAFLDDWQRPDGPPRVGIQVGHWKVEEAPEELEFLHKNTGTSWQEHTEVEVNMEIALLTAAILEENGVVTELFPVRITPGYIADAFIAIHADGSENPNLSGFKSAVPWVDLTGDGNKLKILIDFNYQKITQLPNDSNITENMFGYYAFRWWGVEHSVHPMTTAVILETGFLTSPIDRNIIIHQQELAAQGLADGIMEYLRSEGLL